jgi:hypothetical protein
MWASARKKSYFLAGKTRKKKSKKIAHPSSWKCQQSVSQSPREMLAVHEKKIFLSQKYDYYGYCHSVSVRLSVCLSLRLSTSASGNIE